MLVCNLRKIFHNIIPDNLSELANFYFKIFFSKNHPIIFFQNICSIKLIKLLRAVSVIILEINT